MLSDCFRFKCIFGQQQTIDGLARPQHSAKVLNKEQLGHSSIAITVDIYRHWIPGRFREGPEVALLSGIEEQVGEKRSQILYEECMGRMAFNLDTQD